MSVFFADYDIISKKHARSSILEKGFKYNKDKTDS